MHIRCTYFAKLWYIVKYRNPPTANSHKAYPVWMEVAKFETEQVNPMSMFRLSFQQVGWENKRAFLLVTDLVD